MHSDFATDDGSPHDAPTFTLHPVRGVVWAAVWGSLTAAGIVMAINYSRMGSKTAARITVVIAVIATIALVAVIFAIPEDINIPNVAFLVPQLVAVYAIANGLQGDQVRQHAARCGTVVDNAWEDAETVEAFRGIGRSLADLAFSPPLKIQLCDEYFTAKESLTIQ